MKTQIKVMTLDDHPLVRKGIESFINTQHDMSIEASLSNAEEALEAIKDKQADVILVDLMLGEGKSGIDVIRAIKKTSPRTAVIVLTSFHTDEYVFPAIKAGALSYLLKNIEPETLVTTIRRAAMGQAILDPVVALKIVNDLQLSDAHHKPLGSQLSARESEVLSLIAEGKNNQEISDQLHIAVKTVRCHVSHILNKLHLRDRTQAAIHAIKKGMV